MASVGVLSARPQLSGARLNRSASKRVGKVSTVVRAEHKPGINMPEGDPNALNKWSRKITQPKSQGASQVRQATHQIRCTDRDRFCPRIARLRGRVTRDRRCDHAKENP